MNYILKYGAKYNIIYMQTSTQKLISGVVRINHNQHKLQINFIIYNL